MVGRIYVASQSFQVRRVKKIMSEKITSGIDTFPSLDVTLAMPYTLTTGLSVATFLAALADHVILGSRCAKCSMIIVPAQDYCGRCGSAADGFYKIADTGTITAITRGEVSTLAFIHLDGADMDILHRLMPKSSDAKIGDRVRAVWASETDKSILTLEGFELSEGEKDSSTPVKFEGHVEGIAEIPYKLDLQYEHAYGPHYGRLFDEMATYQRIIGSLCPQCKNVLVPPREFCDICFVRTTQYVDVADTGRIQAFSIIHLEFVGQTRKPPYIYTEIVLDGSATRLIHNIGGIDITKANELLKIGMRVKAVWKAPEDCKGSLDDIEYFEPIFE